MIALDSNLLAKRLHKKVEGKITKDKIFKKKKRKILSMFTSKMSKEVICVMCY